MCHDSTVALCPWSHVTRILRHGEETCRHWIKISLHLKNTQQLRLSKEFPPKILAWRKHTSTLFSFTNNNPC